MKNNTAKEKKMCEVKLSLDINKLIIMQNRVLRAFGKYLSEHYLMGEDFDNKIPYKIFEYKLNNGKISITNYSPEFLRMFYNQATPYTNYSKINKAIDNLKSNNYKLYQSLLIVWDKDYIQLNCNLSTIYRRYNKALFIIASELGLLTNDVQELYKNIREEE